MTRPERASDYLEHIASAIDRACRYAAHAGSVVRLEQDEQAQDAIVRTLMVVGEAVTQLQKIAPDFVAAHPEVPWSLMRGMRNKVVHDYIDVDLEVVWNTVEKDLPLLRQQVARLLQDLTA
jgi:uncharacterized protein with HEPN domain